MPVATLADLPLLLDEPISWASPTGVEPGTGRFRIARPMVAEFVYKGGQPVTLKIGDDEFKNLWIRDVEPTENPYIFRVVVSDRRWFWKRRHIERRFNMRRSVGVKRVIDVATIELQTVEQDIQYWAWSTKDGNGTPWECQEVLEEVLREAFMTERNYRRLNSIQLPIKAEFIDGVKIKATSIENLELIGRGDAQVARALSYMPDLTLAIDADGDVVLSHKGGGKEVGELAKLGPEIWTAGHAQKVASPLEMPEYIDVLFNWRCDIRQDAIEQADDAEVVESAIDVMFMENVLVQPDHTLTVGGKSCPEGTIHTYPSYLGAIGTPPGIGRAIDMKMLREAAVPFIDFWSPMELAGQLERDPSIDWPGRIGALRDNFRVFYRMNPKWADRCLNIEAVRVSIVSPTTGTLGRAVAYSDYSVLGSQRSMVLEHLAGKTINYAVNVYGYPTGGSMPGMSALTGSQMLDADSKPSPVEVTIEDAQRGLIRLHWKTDRGRQYEQVLPSTLENVVGENLREAGRLRALPGQPTRASQISFNGVLNRADVPRLAASHKLAAIFTAVPATAPLCRIRIKPKEIESMLQAEAAPALSRARGPAIEIKIGPGVETARCRWLDKYGDNTARLFGVLPLNDNDDVMTFAEPILVNLKPQSEIGTEAASLIGIAKAAAARRYQQYIDRWKGIRAGMINRDVTPVGRIGAVEHRMATDGVATTTISFPEQAEELDFLPLLDASTRAIILRQVPR